MHRAYPSAKIVIGIGKYYDGLTPSLSSRVWSSIYYHEFSSARTMIRSRKITVVGIGIRPHRIITFWEKVGGHEVV